MRDNAGLGTCSTNTFLHVYSNILGLHHVTATVSEAQADLDFAVGTLGMRLVKKTVNFDNTGVYHFYYGDELGRPGSLWTTFPYHGRGIVTGTKGAGQVVISSFSVPLGSLSYWRQRLLERGVQPSDGPARFGETSLHVADPSGLQIALVAAPSDERAPWLSGTVDVSHATRGLHSVTLLVRDPGPTVGLMTDLLGFARIDEDDACIRMAVHGGGPGRTIDVAFDPAAPVALNGLGTVHHVAVAVENAAEQRRIREQVVGRGIPVTPVMDRQYFQSIYFREPGGVLFEVATVGPGFATDESPQDLGSALKLPTWEEANRRLIEARLPAVRV